ncbi:DUF6973 domain-containing protein [Thermomonospora amylolytica]|uniref:DUF6973 domain-containing protein n=1 Tax=Thermomonospora amylolytica TaxID=1411117 RepID=UPI000E6B7120|nr:hypothetical protein [Thermomonospora amylolytica]
MTTFEALRNTKLGSLDDAIQAWLSLGRNLTKVRDELKGMQTRDLAGWKGKDADAARAQIKTLEEKATAAAHMATGVGKVLASARQQFKRAQDSLEASISNAAHYRIKVGEDGSVHPPEPTAEQRKDPRYAKAMEYYLADIKTQLASALRVATEADQEISKALSMLTPSIVDDPDGANLAKRLAYRALWSANPNDVPGRRPLAEILDRYQVTEDPDGMTKFPEDGLKRFVSWLSGNPPKDVTVSEREALEELGWHPLKEAMDAYNTATAASVDRTGRFDGHGDAFRHAYWNALLARDLDDQWVEKYTIAHERIPDNPGVREAMDLHNNEVGRQIAREHPDASNEELAKYVEQAIREGRMVVIDRNGQLAWSDTVQPGNTLPPRGVDRLPEYGPGNDPEDVGK